MMDKLSVLLAALCLPCLDGQALESIPSTSVVKTPEEALSLSCRGTGFDFSQNGMHWIRQPAGKALEWMGLIYYDASKTVYASNVQGRTEITRDNSNSMTYLRLSNLKPEDSAVYYCARGGLGDAFDYWGHGTEVRVSTVNAASPTLFPLVQCAPGSADKITIGCLAKDFYPKSLTFQWTDGSGKAQTSVQHPLVEKNNKYTGVSLLQVQKADWDSKRSFNCSVTHPGGHKSVTLEKLPPPKVILLAVPGEDDQALVCTIQNLQSNDELSVKWKKGGNDVTGSTTWAPEKIGSLYSTVSVLTVTNTDWDSGAVYTCEVTHQGTKHTKKVTKAPTTMTLRHSSPKDMFINKQWKLECVVTGQNIEQIQITWEIDGQDVTGNNTETIKSGDSKISTITRSRSDWQGVNKVRCLAIGDDMTPVIQDLTFNKGDGSKPEVIVHVLPEEDIPLNSVKVTLVCLVSSRLKTDYYIAWSEQIGQTAGSYTDGIDSLPQKTKDGYSVTSIYTTTKDKWDNNTMFACSAWPVASDKPMRSRDVSKALNNSTYCKK